MGFFRSASPVILHVTAENNTGHIFTHISQDIKVIFFYLFSICNKLVRDITPGPLVWSRPLDTFIMPYLMISYGAADAGFFCPGITYSSVHMNAQNYLFSLK